MMVVPNSERGHDTASQAKRIPAPRRRYAHFEEQTPVSYDRSVQIAAARLRLVTDSHLGLETPDWVKELAAGKSPR